MSTKRDPDFAFPTATFSNLHLHRPTVRQYFFFTKRGEMQYRSESIKPSSGNRSPVRAILAATGNAIAATVDERLEFRARHLA